jgi:hypothetical protein
VNHKWAHKWFASEYPLAIDELLDALWIEMVGKSDQPTPSPEQLLNLVSLLSWGRPRPFVAVGAQVSPLTESNAGLLNCLSEPEHPGPQ